MGTNEGNTLDSNSFTSSSYGPRSTVMIEVVIIKFVLAGIVFFAALTIAGFHTWVVRESCGHLRFSDARNVPWHSRCGEDVHEGGYCSSQCRQGPPQPGAFFFGVLRADDFCGNPVRRPSHYW